MDDRALEQRIAQLETALQDLTERYRASLQGHARRRAALAYKIEVMLTRIRDLASVESAALDAFDQTHDYFPRTIPALDYDALMAAFRLNETIHRLKNEAEPNSAQHGGDA